MSGVYNLILWCNYGNNKHRSVTSYPVCTKGLQGSNIQVRNSGPVTSHPNVIPIFTARKRSLRRLCLHRCLSVHSDRREGRAWQGGGVSGGCAWQGACVAGRVCMPRTPPWQILWLQHTANEWAVRILLEYILVLNVCTSR